MNRFTLKDVVLNAIIAASYFVLVFVFQFLSFEAIQFRIAEVLLILVLFNAKLSAGLIVGTFVANLVFSPFGLIDAAVGTLASAFAIIFMILLKKIPIIAMLMPALFNGIFVGYMIYYFADIQTLSLFFINFFWIFLGEFVVLYLLGYPVYRIIDKREDLKELIV